MKRREALSAVGLIVGGTIIGAEAFLSGCSRASDQVLITPDQLALLNEVGETILPSSDTPGAKEADVAGFMNSIVTDFYTLEEQQVFQNGVMTINKAGFGQMSKTDRADFLMKLEQEAKAHYEAVRKEEKTGDHYYMMIKQLTIWGYLTSEIVAKSAFEHIPIPGVYIGCKPLDQNQKFPFSESGSGSARGQAMKSLRNG